ASLQVGASSAAVARDAGQLKIVHWQDALDSVEETAALMAALDGVVSVCSWVVHLAGALGRPTLALAPYAPEWRYGHSGDRMLWYPSVRVMRQPAFGDWDSLLASLRSALAAGRWSQ